MEVLNHDVVESILERVPVKSLLRLKFVSKRWQSTIESKNFEERQLLIHRQQSPGRDVLFLTIGDSDCDDTIDTPSSSSLFSYSSVVDDNDEDHYTKTISSSSIKVHIKKWFDRSSNSCDGLVCLCNKYESIIINPTTRWHRTFPLSNFQKRSQGGVGWRDCVWLGFGKDKFNGAYKLVRLYNKNPFVRFDSKKTITTCEVFDFGNNAWRYVTCPASPYDIIDYVDPVHVDGSLHWLTKLKYEELDIHVLSFDLHTETFQVIVKAPFYRPECNHYMMCNLNNRLCVSEINRPYQVIWLFDSGSKTWKNMCAIDLEITYSWFRNSTKYEQQGIMGNRIRRLTPLAVLEEQDKKTMKVLFYFGIYKKADTYFVIYDVQTKSFDFAFKFMSREKYFDYPICCFQSLISI